jgi:hypothetical protein
MTSKGKYLLEFIKTDPPGSEKFPKLVHHSLDPIKSKEAGGVTFDPWVATYPTLSPAEKIPQRGCCSPSLCPTYKSFKIAPA